LGLLALGLLVLGPAEARSCEVVAAVPLWGEVGPVYEVRQQACASRDQVQVCHAGACVPHLCAGIVGEHDSEYEPGPDEVVEALWPLPRGTSGQDVLVVERTGQGSYPRLSRYRLQGTELTCEPFTALDTVLDSVPAQLGPDEDLGLAGARIEVRGAQLVVTAPVFRSEDPACCPSGGAIEVTGKIEVDGVRPVRIRRLGSGPARELGLGSYL
jgi:hypothetical protein